MLELHMPDASAAEMVSTKISKPIRMSPQSRKDVTLLQAILKSVREGIVCANLDGSIVEINERAEQILDKKRDELVGKSIFDLLPPQMRRRVLSMMDVFKSSPQQELRILSRWSNNRWMEIRLAALTNKSGGLLGIMASYYDRTETKQLEEKQRALELKLLHEHKLSAIGFLASGIAHNLNGPLSVIMGYLDLLYSRYPDLNDIPMILAQTERMKEIITNMMIKSRHEQDTRKRPLNINTILQNELKFLEANLEFKHKIDKQYEYTPGLPDIYGVYSDFSQSFLNIVNNALDAMVDSPVKNLSVKTDFDPDNIYVEFNDTGCGLDPSEADRLFSPFYSTKPPVGEANPGRPTGTGLGLSSAFQLIKSYGGNIYVDGEPGVGAKFTVVIPIEQNLPPKESSAQARRIEEDVELEV